MKLGIDLDLIEIDPAPCLDCARFHQCKDKKLACQDFLDYYRGKEDFPRRVPTRANYNLIFEES